MRFKREEAFRYEFQEPLAVEIQLAATDEKEEAKKIKGKIIELSPDGARLTTEDEIAGEEITISFKLNDKNYYFTSNIVWTKQLMTTYTYGLSHNIDEELQREIIEEIKVYARNH
ncbi:PilZ domain-containing protein [Ornithinibacillus contaminans]|uniref:PilZ domain-containing protein n=1 Tax=Ornithinibacillus contaminans TaxID=694055 RepID=UPI00064E06BE|nr:PilZ domain-containing protein [Ornithinibacillus contaminans]